MATWRDLRHTSTRSALCNTIASPVTLAVEIVEKQAIAMTEGIVASCEGVHDARPVCWMWSTRHRRQARRVDGRLHLLLFVLCLTLLPGCMSSYSFVVPAAGWQPPMGAAVLLLPPDVQLSLQRAGGLMEPRADWTLTAYNNLKSALAQEFEELGIDTVVYEEHGEASPWRPEHAGLVKLHEAVGAAILTSRSLPTQRGNLPHLNHSLGDTVALLEPSYDARYAILLHSRGAYASGGRVALTILAAIGNVRLAPATQQEFVSLVDLEDGRVIWFNVLPTRGSLGNTIDARTPEGATTMVAALLDGLPL